MKLAIRGYVGRRKIFEEVIETDGSDLELIAERHLARVLLYAHHMIEFEFLEEPDPLKRFFRFGTDPSRMVKPIAVGNLEDLK